MFKRLIFTIYLILSFTIFISAQNLNGSFTVQLNGPATNQQVNQAKSGARLMLKKELIKWLKTTHDLKIDTTNALTNFTLDIFTDSCTNRSKNESSFRGKELTIIYTLNENTAEEALSAFNKAVKDSALNTYNQATKAQTENNIPLLFESSVKAYVFSNAVMGESIITPESNGSKLSDDAQNMLQSLFNRMKIKASDMIINGKIGRVPENPPTVTVVIDSTPLPNLWFSGTLQSGKPSFDSRSDEQGVASLKDLIIPIVPNGALFYLTPDLGKILGASLSISPKNIRIQLKDGQVQTFMFKVAQPTYSLEYKVSSDPSVKLPADFNNISILKKYLRDSCFLTETQNGLPPDFMITIQSVISNSATDVVEERGLKMNAEVTIKGLSLATPKTETKKVELVKLYGKQLEIPYGLFLWDVNSTLKQSIKSTLNKL